MHGQVEQWRQLRVQAMRRLAPDQHAITQLPPSWSRHFGALRDASTLVHNRIAIVAGSRQHSKHGISADRRELGSVTVTRMKLKLKPSSVVISQRYQAREDGH